MKNGAVCPTGVAVHEDPASIEKELDADDHAQTSLHIGCEVVDSIVWPPISTLREEANSGYANERIQRTEAVPCCASARIRPRAANGFQD